MTSQEAYLGSQTTKRYEIPLSHLDYTYIEACKDDKELEKILKILKSGDEGFYPELERLAEDQLKKVNPKSRILRKEVPVAHPGDLPKEEWSSISDDLLSWSAEMKSMEETLRPAKLSQKNPQMEQDAMPIRSAAAVSGSVQNVDPAQTTSQKTKKRVAPRDYREWEKLDREIDRTLEEEEAEDSIARENKKYEAKAKSHSGLNVSDEYKQKIKALSLAERKVKAVREKEKGNESYRSCDYEEAVHFYAKSLLCDPSAVSTYNNRAMAYLQLSCWQEALKDCDQVLRSEPENIKALLRRGSAFQGQKKWKLATADFTRVLSLEPHNKRARDLLETVQKARQKAEEEHKQRGRRIVIEDTEGSESGGEEILPTNSMNGHSSEISEAGTSRRHKGDGDSPVREGTAAQEQQQEKNIWEDEEVEERNYSSSFQSMSANSHSLSLERDCSSVILTPCESEKEILELTSETTGVSASVSTEETSACEEDLDAKIRTEDSRDGEEEGKSIDAISPDEVQTEKYCAESMDESEEAELLEEHQRPILHLYPLLPHVSKFREEGNKLFEKGQYADAIIQYTHAINYLERELHQTVNLSRLYSNRAICKLKIGDSRAAKEDCDAALLLVPHSIKPLIRRARAMENLERFQEAYRDYRHALNLDASLVAAQEGAARCQKLLQSLHGMHWRDRLPKLMSVRPEEIPQIMDAPEEIISGSQLEACSKQSSHQSAKQVSGAPEKKQAGMSATRDLDSQSAEGDSGSATSQGRPSSTSQAADELEDFDLLKERGNQLVRQGNYAEAMEIYSKCLKRSPYSVPCLTNRALCNLKLKKPELVMKDCSKALDIEPENIKALYRRSLALREQGKLRLSMEDLIKLLKLEPTNSAAQREMDILKGMYKEVFARERAKREHARFDSNFKPRKNVQIEEFDEPEMHARPRLKKGKKGQRGSRKTENLMEKSKNELSATSGAQEDAVVLEGQHPVTMGLQQPAPSGNSSVCGTPDVPVSGTPSTSTSGTPGTPTARAHYSSDTDTSTSHLSKAGFNSSSGARLPCSSSPELQQQQPSRRGVLHSAGAKHPSPAEPLPEALSRPSVVKTTAYEFMSAWNSLKTSSNHHAYANLLRQTELEQLPRLISNKLDGRMLQTFMKCAASISQEDPLWSYRLLINLSQVQRFSVVASMMTCVEKEDAKRALFTLEASKSPHYTRSDISRMRKAYGIL